RADVEVDIYFSTGTKDFKKEIEEIKNLPAIFISVNSEALTKILVELEDRNYKGKIYVSTASLDDRDLIKTAAQNLAGVKFASFENYTGETYDDFAAAYKIAYNETPGIHAAETYDAVQILAKAMEDKGFDAAGIVGGLYGIKNYNGASGKITFDNNGDVSDRSFDYRVGHYDEEKEEVSFENLGSL
ncbi:ABC transporter substrate-binding protein, partial [Patescibacteria group bacterium]|nr:ABC transporter substrate-binding protein [Patescibacteria group bacterium]